jgi:hypothetical protein
MVLRDASAEDDAAGEDVEPRRQVVVRKDQGQDDDGADVGSRDAPVNHADDDKEERAHEQE